MVERYLRQGALAQLKLASRVDGSAAKAGVTLSDRGFQGQLCLRGTGDAAFVASVEAVVKLAPPLEPNRVALKGGTRILWLGPDEWLIALPEEKVSAVWKKLMEVLHGQHASVTDVSEARTVIGLSGPRARDTLAHGCSLDLHPRVFQPGFCAQTLLARMPVILHQKDVAPSYDIYIQRSLAEYLWGWLEDAARDYGIAVSEA